MRSVAACLLAFLLSAASTAFAQASNPAIGEMYHVEFTAVLWNPTPALTVSSEQFGLVGSDIDLVADAGLRRKRLADVRFVVRPFRKHKFRFEYVPMSYSGSTTLTRTLVFNGQRYTAGLPLTMEFKWQAARVGYEYDFVYRDRGFVGFILEAKYTGVRTSLAVPAGPIEFTKAQAPIPAVGLIARYYPLTNTAITAEVTGFRLPKNVSPQYQARYTDVDVYATLNFTDNVGVTAGYRVLNAFYLLKHDTGHLDMRGFYLGGALRY